MHFRLATVDDATAISELISALGGNFAVNADGSGAELFWQSVSEASERSYIQNPRYQFTLALVSDKLAGFIAMRDTTHLFHLFVAADQQRQGLATRLWQTVHQDLQAKGHQGNVTVNSSLSAQAVYGRLGFTPVGPVTHVHGIAFIPMARPVSSNRG